MLNNRQLRFIEEYSISHSAADAARKAGYSEKTARSIGHELLTKPDILEAIRARQQVTALELGVTRQNVIADLMEAIQTAREQRNPSAMISGSREVGKMLGFYAAELHQVDLTLNERDLAAKYETMTDQELTAIIDGQCTTV